MISRASACLTTWPRCHSVGVCEGDVARHGHARRCSKEFGSAQCVCSATTARHPSRVTCSAACPRHVHLTWSSKEEVGQFRSARRCGWRGIRRDSKSPPKSNVPACADPTKTRGSGLPSRACKVTSKASENATDCKPAPTFWPCFPPGVYQVKCLGAGHGASGSLARELLHCSCTCGIICR